MSEDFSIDGMKIDLPNGRYVWAGKHEESYYIEFQNAEGVKTRLRLSYEASNALRFLLGEPIEADGVVKAFIMHMATTMPETKEKMVWREVKPDTLPVAVP